MTPPEPIPARMLNEVAYCPRLYALEHLAGEWADSVDTVEGRTVHRRVDKPSRDGLPEPADDPDRPRAVRSVKLGDEALGMIAVIDLVEADGRRAVPIDYKKGAVPDVPEGAWEPERVQVCAQILLLRAHGYEVPYGELYFAGSKRRVRVEADEALVARTLACRDEARRLLASEEMPPPLVDSPKCRGCSLIGICLPDEHNVLTGRSEEVRPLVPARDDRVPMYVMVQGGKVRKDGGEIVVEDKTGVVGRARLAETSQVVLMGNITITTPLLHELAGQDIPVAFHTFGGWYHGTFAPVTGRNVLNRIAQHDAARDPARTLAVAKRFVQAKVSNQRVLLRRNGQGVPDRVLALMAEAVEEAGRVGDLDALRGVEGSAARQYFEHLPLMIRSDLRDTFRFDGRNRRPPRDPVNALLSFAYACLAREVTHAVMGVGLDAWVGFLHTPRPGRAALALDLMEEFRPIVADSAVFTAINNGVVQRGDFVVHPTGVALTDRGRRLFIQTYERRLDELVTHPTFGTRLSYRRVLEVQARLLCKHLLGEMDAYPGFRVR